MKLNKMTAVGMIVTFIFFAATWAQAGEDEVDVPVTAVLEDATITLTQVNDLDFGTIILPTSNSNDIEIDASAGSVTGSTVSDSGSAMATGGASGLVTVATNVDANAGITYEIISGNDGDADVLDAFGHEDTIACEVGDIQDNSTGPNVQLTAAGPNEIHIGGKITVANANTNEPGTYEGVITVEVSHQ